MGERHLFADCASMSNLPAGGLADVAAWIHHKNTIGEVDLAQVECAEQGLLFVCERLAVCLAWRDDDGTGKSQISVRLSDICSETQRAANADNLGSIKHS